MNVLLELSTRSLQEMTSPHGMVAGPEQERKSLLQTQGSRGRWCLDSKYKQRPAENRLQWQSHLFRNNFAKFVVFPACHGRSEWDTSGDTSYANWPLQKYIRVTVCIIYRWLQMKEHIFQKHARATTAGNHSWSPHMARERCSKRQRTSALPQQLELCISFTNLPLSSSQLMLSRVLVSGSSDGLTELNLQGSGKSFASFCPVVKALPSHGQVWNWKMVWFIDWNRAHVKMVW